MQLIRTRHLAQQWHTVTEVGAILRCHEKTLYQWVKKGLLTAIRIGAKLTFEPADVAAFLASRRTC